MKTFFSFLKTEAQKFFFFKKEINAQRSCYGNG